MWQNKHKNISQVCWEHGFSMTWKAPKHGKSLYHSQCMEFPICGGCVRRGGDSKSPRMPKLVGPNLTQKTHAHWFNVSQKKLLTQLFVQSTILSSLQPTDNTPTTELKCGDDDSWENKRRLQNLWLINVFLFFFKALTWVNNKIFPFEGHFKVACDLLSLSTH